MKRLICLLLALLSVLALFAGCKAANVGSDGDTNAPEKLENEQTTAPEETEPDVDTTAPEDVDLPEYVSGSLELVDRKNDDYHFERKYRILYYGIPGFLWKLMDDEQMEDFNGGWTSTVSKETNYGEFQEEMFLVTWIKRYNISREAFEQAVADRIAFCELNNWSYNTCEEDELPNADIIYTFDNEIINNFYRYE